MSIDLDQLLGDMAGAAEDAAGGVWPQIRDFASAELKSLAEMLVTIETLGVPEDEAQLLMKLHARTTEIVLASIESMTLIAAEAIVNAVVDVLRVAANSALGFNLFPTS